MNSNTQDLPDIRSFYVGKKIPSLYPANKGFVVIKVEAEKKLLIVRQEGSTKPRTIHLDEIV